MCLVHESKQVCVTANCRHHQCLFAANERELHEKETKMMELQETYETLLLQHKVGCMYTLMLVGYTGEQVTSCLRSTAS